MYSHDYNSSWQPDKIFYLNSMWIHHNVDRWIETSWKVLVIYYIKCVLTTKKGM